MNWIKCLLSTNVSEYVGHNTTIRMKSAHFRNFSSPKHFSHLKTERENVLNCNHLKIHKLDQDLEIHFTCYGYITQYHRFNKGDSASGWVNKEPVYIFSNKGKGSNIGSLTEIKQIKPPSFFHGCFHSSFIKLCFIPSICHSQVVFSHVPKIIANLVRCSSKVDKISMQVNLLLDYHAVREQSCLILAFLLLYTNFLICCAGFDFVYISHYKAYSLKNLV